MAGVFQGKATSRRLRWLPFLLVMASLAGPLQPAFAKTREGVNADVPFKFKIGDRTFRSGHYQLIIVGANLLAVKDAHAHTVASLITRPVEYSGPAGETKLVFKLENKGKRLVLIVIANHSQALEVVGEQVAFRQAGPPREPVPDLVINSLFERHGAPGFRH